MFVAKQTPVSLSKNLNLVESLMYCKSKRKVETASQFVFPHGMVKVFI